MRFTPESVRRSLTRFCILTGRNHHSNNVAAIMETATGFPGYDGRMLFENGMLPEMLLEHGYNTFYPDISVVPIGNTPMVAYFM